MKDLSRLNESTNNMDLKSEPNLQLTGRLQ